MLILRRSLTRKSAAEEAGSHKLETVEGEIRIYGFDQLGLLADEWRLPVRADPVLLTQYSKL